MKIVKILIGFSVLGMFLMISCKSNPRFTKHDSEEMQKLNVQDSFRFYVSTDVQLKRAQVEIAAANKNTVVKQSVVNNVILLNKNTTGRAYTFDGESIWIYFEPADKNGDYKTIRFILKPKDPNNIKATDLFRFYYEEDVAALTENIVEQEGQRKIESTEAIGDLIAYGKDENGDLFYEVSYRGKEEPYLLYRRDMKETTKKRVMKGVR
jgi:hypothetical protein